MLRGYFGDTSEILRGWFGDGSGMVRGYFGFTGKKSNQHPYKFGNSAMNAYFYIVKSKSKKSSKIDHSLREQILHSMMASFKIEGIKIPIETALATLKKVELNLGK
jgi:hypothetical protein